MKKTCFVLLLLLMMAVMTNAYAATGKPGDTVSVTLSVTSNTTAAGGKVSFSFDSSALEFVSATSANGWTEPKTATGNFTIALSGETIPIGAMGTITFKIKDDAKPDTYQVTANVVKATDSTQKVVTSSVKVSGESVTVEPGPCAHEKTHENIVKAATCTAKGEKQIVCDNCGEVVKTEEIPIDPNNHKWDAGKITTEPTCAKKGVRTYTCQNNSKHTKTEDINIDPTKHAWDEGKVTKAPTCTEKGEKTFTCKNDASHTKTEDIAIDPTTHDWGEWVVTTKPVGDTPGEETRVCKNDASHKETRPTVCAHENTAEEVTEPFCEKDGERKTVCLDCGETLKTEVIQALGHDWGEGNVATAPKCTEKGVKTFTCKRCGETKTEEIPALDHLWGEEEVIEPTCTEAGSKTITCQRCKEQQAEEIPPLGHIAGEWEVLKEATEEEDGLRQLKCTRCGEVLREERLTLHKIDWRYNQTVTAKGIRYRDIKPGLTNKWFMFTPIDLNQNGVQTFDLLVANARRIGSVTVTVQDGKAVVNYRMFKTVDQLDMGFALLPDLDSVTDVEAIDYSRFAFGQEISVQDDLDGDALVLLQVMGHVNYDFEDGRYEQFSSVGKDYADYVNALKALMD